MHSILSDSFVDSVTVNGNRHKLRTDAETVLRALDDLKRDDMLQEDRARLACWRLFRIPRPRDTLAALNAAWELLNEPSPYRHTGGGQTLDIEQDAALICAAFRQLYGIDLPSELKRMDWRYFQALLSGITEDTAIGGIMAVRSMKIPKWSPTNAEYIRDIQKQKAIYAIKPKPGTAGSFGDGLRGMAEVLRAMAGKDD